MSLFIKDKQFYKKAAGIALPIALQGLITNGIKIMDTVMVGTLGRSLTCTIVLRNVG